MTRGDRRTEIILLGQLLEKTRAEVRAQLQAEGLDDLLPGDEVEHRGIHDDPDNRAYRGRRAILLEGVVTPEEAEKHAGLPRQKSYTT